LAVPYKIRTYAYRFADYLATTAENKNAKYAKVVRACSGANSVTLSDPRFLSLAQSRNLFCRGYYFRDSDDVIKHTDAIRAYFVPVDKYLHKIENTMLRIRNSGAKVIGVHIRQGDYVGYKEGQWYFETLFYVKVMHDLRRLFGKQQKVMFLICSDAQQNGDNFKGFHYYISMGKAIEDLYLLSMCDYIVGPPSSFSRWASFYGNVPLGLLLSKNTQLVFNRFKVNDRLSGY